MPTLTRMYWFREQMKKGRDQRGTYSLMGYGTKLLSEDICAIGGPYRSKAACETSQSRFDPKNVPAQSKR